tara:strand:+ start:607 stop:1311 length:705 start_codon:yes stop_codon:yes gene_type:complete
MKKTFFTISLILLTITGFTQDRKGYIGISFGSSFPTGDFAAIDGEGAGYAERGLNMSLVNFCYKFNENIGIAAAWHGIVNPVDVQEMVEDMWATNPTLSWGLETTAWSIGGLSGGILISSPYNNLDFDCKALIGFAQAISPQLDITISDGFTAISARQDALESNTSLSFSFGGGVRYHISEKWALNLNLDYFTTQVEFPEFNISYSDGTYTTAESFEQNISALNLTVGIGYRLK